MTKDINMKEETIGGILSTDDNLSIYEVIISSLKKPQYKEIIMEFLSEELFYHVLIAHFDPNVNYLFPDSIIDYLMTYFDNFSIRDHGEYIHSSAEMGGADPAAYPPDGSWTADLYEFLGHYMWIEPEGEEYGFFNDLSAAESFGIFNWVP